MAGPHENLEHAEHAEHASHGGNKKIALLISVLALFLAFSETLGKGAQTESIGLNIKASDTWNFFQAKTIRQTTLRASADNLAAIASSIEKPEAKTTLDRQIETWRATAARYESDPKEKDGRKELREQAEHYEHQRDYQLARYHQFELGSAAFQIGIVLASAEVITGMVMLGWLSGLVGLVGVAFSALGLWAPHALDFLLHASGAH